MAERLRECIYCEAYFPYFYHISLIAHILDKYTHILLINTAPVCMFCLLEAFLVQFICHKKLMKNTNSVSSFNHLNDAYASDKKKLT